MFKTNFELILIQLGSFVLSLMVKEVTDIPPIASAVHPHLFPSNARSFVLNARKKLCRIVSSFQLISIKTSAKNVRHVEP